MASAASEKSSRQIIDLDEQEAFRCPEPPPETEPSAERVLRAFAAKIGVADRIRDLLADCDQALNDLAGANRTRWLWRIEGQRRLLLRPPIRVIAAICTCLCEEDPNLAEPLAPLLARLAQRRPELWPFHRRAVAAREAWSEGLRSVDSAQSA